MSKTVIIKCDLCGKVIQKSPFVNATSFLSQMDAGIKSYIFHKTGGKNIEDYCDECGNSIVKGVSDIIDNLMSS